MLYIPAMNYRLFLPLIALLIFAACSDQRHVNTRISNGEIPIEFYHIDGTAGMWDENRRVIYLGSMTAKYTIFHEGCHAADSLGLPIHRVMQMIGHVPGYPAHMEMSRKLLAETIRIGGKDAHWKALHKICGPQSVYHSEILARIR